MDLNHIAQCWFAQFQFPLKFAFVLIGIGNTYTNANDVIIITDIKLLNLHI